MKKVIHLAVLLWAGLAATAMLSQTSGTPKTEEPRSPKAEEAKPSKLADATPDADTPPDYVIGADDTLHISVWKEPDLTNTLPVRPDGKISMPLLNDVQAAGLTPMQLATSLTEKLKKYLADPRVTVLLREIHSQRVYVTGEVVHSGAMNLTPDMTVLQALASAGFSQFA